MIGALASPDTLALDSPELCRDLSLRLGGLYRPLPAPIVMSSVSAARAMLREEAIVTTLELAGRADIALCGIGNVHPNGTSGRILQGFLTPARTAEIRGTGAIAHLSGHHFDARGQHVTTSLCDRLTTLSPERLATVPLSVATAWGYDKVPAIHAVLTTGYINTLATDEPTAHALLDLRS